MMKRIFGLVGYPLSHSFSPEYFLKKFEKENISDAEYRLFSMTEIKEIRNIVLAEKEILCGLNITIPYKNAVIQYLDQLSPEAEEIGAVNTIKIYQGKWTGYNTDVIGLEKSLLEFMADTRQSSALILGDGGSARSVRYVLDKLNIAHKTVSRKPGLLQYFDLDKNIIKSNKLIINTSPVGMYPDIEKCPDIPYSELDERHFLFDLIYNPEKTLFLANGEARNSQIKNGLQMLQLQAESAWQIWNQ